MHSRLHAACANSIGWFTPDNICRRTARKTLAISATLFGLVKSAAATGTACFEFIDAGMLTYHDSKLDCDSSSYFNNATSIVSSLLNSTCSAYLGTMGLDFTHDACEPNTTWTKSINIGAGFFGGTQCTYTYHSFDMTGNAVTPNACIVNFLNDQVKSGFGTETDTFTAFGISVASACLIATSCAGLFSLYNKKTRAPLDDAVALDDFADTVESESFSIV